MATPMHVFAELAAKYGHVDPENEEAVLLFFEEQVLKLPENIQVAIGEELFARDGEPSNPIKARSYTKDAPVPKLSEITKSRV